MRDIWENQGPPFSDGKFVGYNFYRAPFREDRTERRERTPRREFPHTALPAGPAE